MFDLETIPAEIITIGSELMLGQSLDTNSAAIAKSLTGLGITVIRETSVGDNQAALTLALKRAWRECRVVVVTGGLGPTVDDLTREAAAEAFKRPLIFQKNLGDDLVALFQAHGYLFTENNLKQAYVPKGFQALANSLGSAPGLRFHQRGKTIFFLPGVPREALALMDSEVLPFLRARGRLNGRLVKTLTYRLAGLGESRVDELLNPLGLGPETNPALAMLAKDGEVTVTITARGAGPEEVDRLLGPIARKAAECLRGHIFSTSEHHNLPGLTSDRLREMDITLAVYDGITTGRFLANLAGANPEKLKIVGLTGPGRPETRDLSFLQSKRPDLLLQLTWEQEAVAGFHISGPSLRGERYYSEPGLSRASLLNRLSFWATFKLWSVLRDCENAFR